MSEQYTFVDPPPPYSPGWETSPHPVDLQPVTWEPVTSQPAGLSIYSTPTRDGVVVRVQPPEGPNIPQPEHIPCDIVLVIDLSYSMGDEAAAQMTKEDGSLSSERFGFSILDLTKHAALTIVSTLNERDRLGIVTFSGKAKVVQELLPMTDYNKEETESRIRGFQIYDSTNLWHGIQEGIRLFHGQDDTLRVPAIMILTDGMPNHMNPSKGFISKLRETYEALPATIHTFGFGYNLESGLLKSIAEVGGGNYAFIPDAGMIGTVFIHAVAHLQSTFATRCMLEISTPKKLCLRTTAGTVIDWKEHDGGDEGDGSLTINLGNLQYGQSRDIYLDIINPSNGEDIPSAVVGSFPIAAELVYSKLTAEDYHIRREEDLQDVSGLPESEVAYHKSRSMICNFFSSIFPILGNGQYATTNDNPQRHHEAFRYLLGNIPASNYKDERNKSLMQDLDGQVRLALSDTGYFRTWGCHYFFSLWNAHSKQLRNSFKDHGPLKYNENAYFIKCRDALDNAFDNLPPPTQSCQHLANVDRSNIHMSSINNSENGCFTGSSRVTLASGRQVPARELRRGVSVRTPTGNRLVAAVLKSIVHRIAMHKVGDLVITPWHPVKVGDGMHAEWKFPAKLEQPQVVLYSGPIYSVLLQPDHDAESHALQFGDVWAVTLGHGLVRGDDVRAHRFFGDYVRVQRAIMRLRPGKDGVAFCNGAKRQNGDGLIMGFKKCTRQHYVKTDCRNGLC